MPARSALGSRPASVARPALRWPVAVALVVALGGIVAASCAGSSSAPADDPAGLLRSAVGVEASGCSLVAAIGSGVVLADDTVVTSAHTVAGSDAIVVIDADEVRHEATLVGFDPEADLAVLSVGALGVEPLPLGEAEPDGAGWVLAWHPDVGLHAEAMTVTKAIRVTIEDIYVDEIVERDAIEIAAEIEHGDSGGAVVTADGAVVGVVYATSRERSAGFALDDGEIAAALDAAGTDPVDSGPCT